eukprot:XP_003729974.1 PREDICTED: uncharacterized protein LOC100889973 [Strongylocentrotus purpuratus]
MQATSYPTQPGVPGQTVYVHQPAPVNYATRVQNPNSSSGVSQNFNGAAGRATGWIQLFLGIGSIVVAIAELVLHTSVGYVAMGIWASVLFYIPTGILGICSMQKNTCVIIGYLTMCIITANVAFGQMIAGIIGAGIFSNFFYYPYGYNEPGLREGSIASDSLLAILGLIEMIVAIVASAYCCGGMACGNSSSLTTTTVYTQQNTPMVVTTGQYTQPAGIAQPPPAYNVQQAYPPAGQPVAPAPYNQAPGAQYNQAPTAPYNQAPAAPHYQALGAPYNQQAAAAPTKPGEVVA